MQELVARNFKVLFIKNLRTCGRPHVAANAVGLDMEKIRIYLTEDAIFKQAYDDALSFYRESQELELIDVAKKGTFTASVTKNSSGHQTKRLERKQCLSTVLKLLPPKTTTEEHMSDVSEPPQLNIDFTGLSLENLLDIHNKISEK